MTGNREHRALRSTAVFTAFNYAGLAASFVSVPLLLRCLGNESYGLMLTALAFMNYLSFSDAGLNWGSIVLISAAHGREDREAMATIFRHSVVLAFGSAVLVVGAGCGLFIAAHHGWRLPMFSSHPEADNLVLIVAAQCAVNLTANTGYSVFQAIQESYWTALYQGCARLAGTIGGIIAAFCYQSAALVLLANVMALVVFAFAAGCHLWKKCPWVFERGSLADVAQYSLQLRTGAKSFGLQIARTIQGTAPVMVISSLAGPAFVPSYSVPATLIGMVFGVFMSWNVSLQPAYGASWAADDRKWVVGAFRRTLNSVLLQGLVGGVAFVIVAPELISLWTHGVLHPSEAMCGSVAVVLMVQAVSSTVQFCLAGINQHRRIAAIELLHSVCAIFCAIAAVRWIGPEGVGIGAAVAYGATASWLGFRELAERLGSGEVVPRSLWIARILLIGAAAIAVGTMIVKLMPFGGVIAALTGAVGGSVLAAATVVWGTILFRVNSREDWNVWVAALKGLPGRLLRRS